MENYVVNVSSVPWDIIIALIEAAYQRARCVDARGTDTGVIEPFRLGEPE